MCWGGHSFSSKEQASFDFMAAVTICNYFGAQAQEKILSLFPLFPHLFAMKSVVIHLIYIVYHRKFQVTFHRLSK